MKKHEREVTQAELDAEKKVLRDLERQYQAALKDIDDKVAQLLGRSDADMPNVIYQVGHQKALRSQIHGILEQLQANEFQTISDFLADSYQQSFVGTMYSMHNQGIPLILPVDKNAMVKAVTTNSRLSEDLYTSLGVDIKKLNNAVRSEISRGISAGLSYNEIARNIANASKAPRSRAATIVRNESHRIREESRNDARDMAKKKGADVVKQWDATLDGDTRKSHRKLDGQIREVDEPFEVDGKKAMYPGDFGRPEEDINCRCISLTRARWELDEAELETLKKRAEFFGIDKTDDFTAFQEKYLESVDKIFTVDSALEGIDMTRMSEKQIAKIRQAAENIQSSLVNLQAETESMDYPYGVVFGFQAETANVQLKNNYGLPFAYDPAKDIIYVNPFHKHFDNYDFNEAMLHELAHRYDRTSTMSWKNDKFTNLLTDANNYAIINKKQLEEIVNKNIDDYYVQDIISVVSGGEVATIAGHKSASPNVAAREVFANLASLRARNADGYTELQTVFPELINEFETLFGGE